MASTMSSSLLILFLTVLLALSFTSAHGMPGKQQAERFRNKTSNERAGLVEAPFRFSGLVKDPASASIADLGHHAGYYLIQNSYAAKMFYFFFESRGSKEDPVMLWLAGGPGSSGQIALFYLNGPFHINQDLSLTWNDFGWDTVSNIIYVDQPTGTGFSYSSDERDFRENGTAVSNDLYDFLQAFFQGHPQFINNDFYISGGSYAGHYIPALASRIVKGNKLNEGIYINLKGCAIGNGLTNPEKQYASYPDFALANKLVPQSAYLHIRDVMVPECVYATQQCQIKEPECMTAYYTCSEIFEKIWRSTGNKNCYDLRKPCVGRFCYDFSSMERFLNLRTVREALGVGDIKFKSYSEDVFWRMVGDWMKNYEENIPPLLEQGIKVLIYVGEYDLLFNWMGNSKWVNSMLWSGHKSFLEAKTVPYIVDGKEAGLIKSFGPLTFLRVHDAGHLVPMDQPNVALHMIKGWMNT